MVQALCCHFIIVFFLWIISIIFQFAISHQVFYPSTLCGWLTKSTKRLTMRRKAKNLGSKGRWASASHWIQHRRAAVQKAVSGKGDEGSSRKTVISKMASKLCGPKHKKEMEFNKKKEGKRRALNQI